MTRGLVRSNDVRALYRVLGEAGEITGGREAQKRHVAVNLAKILGAQVCAFVTDERFTPELGGRITNLVEHGWLTDSDRINVLSMFDHYGSVHDPVVSAHLHAFASGEYGNLSVKRREDIVRDEDWYNAPLVVDAYLPARVDHTIYGMASTSPGSVRGLGVMRGRGAHTYDVEDRNLVELFMLDGAWLWTSDPRTIAVHLAPRERETLELLLEGASLKEAAYAMGITRHTADGYAKKIYRTFRVHSRAELLRLFLRSR